jgi:phosphatidylinositol alpha-1,6-mannosyltransferase
MDANERYKGHDQVLQALHLLCGRGELPSALRWRVVGCGDDQQRLEKQTIALGLEAWVQFLGPLSDQALCEEYQQCQLVVMPSAYGIAADGRAQGEGFGITYLEAAALGRPSIAALEGGHTDLILDGQSGWLVSTDPKDLAMLLRRLIIDPTQIERCGDKAKKRALTEFALAQQRQALMNALQVR